MNFYLILQILYFVILVAVALRIIYDSKNSAKTLAYLMVIILLPVLGMILYFTLGVNHRKRKIYDKKLVLNDKLRKELEMMVSNKSLAILEGDKVKNGGIKKLVKLLLSETNSPLTADNQLELLTNGETKFPKVLEELMKAKSHIHLLYYIIKDDNIGREIENILIAKAQSGVEVRMIYDDFGSHGLGRGMAKRLQKGGVHVFPFYKIRFYAWANRLNYRNHRKIIVIDGKVGFVGGINISDYYINGKENPEQMYWRDTHLMIKGSAVLHLQYLFMIDWNFCAQDALEPNPKYYPEVKSKGRSKVQIASSGPDSDSPTILNSMIQAINLAEKQILLTTPYFIPGETIIKAMILASESGVDVKLLVPYKSDSKLVDWASASYFENVLDAGIEIYRYTKGFVHAKTMVIDDQIAMVGSANLDIRSFDLNFEVNAIMYDQKMAAELVLNFQNDIKSAEFLTRERWSNRSLGLELAHNLARLLSPIL